MISSDFRDLNQFVISPVYFGIIRYHCTSEEEISIFASRLLQLLVNPIRDKDFYVLITTATALRNPPHFSLYISAALFQIV